MIFYRNFPVIRILNPVSFSQNQFFYFKIIIFGGGMRSNEFPSIVKLEHEAVYLLLSACLLHTSKTLNLIYSDCDNCVF